jgi:c-di-GMP-binding flagellar brake protein YcgR
MERMHFDTEAGSAGMEHLAVHERCDVIALFEQVRQRKVPVTLQYGGPGHILQAPLVSLNPAYEEMVFDAGAQASQLSTLVAVGAVSAETALDSIRILFVTGHAEQVERRNRPMLRLRIPGAVTRLQRRDMLRAETPLAERPWLTVRMPLRSAPALRLEVTDVSMSGLGVLIRDPQAHVETGLTLRDSVLCLPGLGALVTGVEFMHIAQADPGTGVRQAGLRFAGLPAVALAHLQRYVTRLERERVQAATRKAA